MTLANLQLIPLYAAVYCENCHQVSNSPGETCCACDSVGGLFSLAQVLGRGPEGHMLSHVDCSGDSSAPSGTENGTNMELFRLTCNVIIP